MNWKSKGFPVEAEYEGIRFSVGWKTLQHIPSLRDKGYFTGFTVLGGFPVVIFAPCRIKLN